MLDSLKAATTYNFQKVLGVLINVVVYSYLLVISLRDLMLSFGDEFKALRSIVWLWTNFSEGSCNNNNNLH